MAGWTGALLFALWGLLHVWVGLQGYLLWRRSPAADQWRMFLGGSEAPFSAFTFPSDPVTIHANANFLLNFCLNVAGFGLLGFYVAWGIVRRASWEAYLLGVFLVGICDVSFTLLQVASGIIRLNLASVSGPVIWLAAVCVTPFGLPRRRDQS